MATSLASSVEKAVPYSGFGIFNLSNIKPNFSLFSAKSIACGEVPNIGAPASNNADVPARYLPCLTYALAFNIACKSPEAQLRIPMIKARYDELWNEVSDADRERASVKFVPNAGVY